MNILLNVYYNIDILEIKYMFSLCYLLNTTCKASGLFIDYGDNHAFSNSFRGIKDQKIYKDDKILINTGQCDLTSYVNFKALKDVVNRFPTLRCPQILVQGDFLECMGIEQMMIAYQQKTTSEVTKEMLGRQYYYLVAANKMGDNYKCMYIHKDKDKPVYPFVFEVYSHIQKTRK